MKNKITLLTAGLLMAFGNVHSQSGFREVTAGHVFNISLPDYMSKTIGLNSAATIQFKNSIKDVYGFVIEDNKEELKLAELNYATLSDFYDDFIKDFLKDESRRKISKPQSKKIGDIGFVECDASYYDKEAKIEIYYFVGLVETGAAFYKVLCWSSLENKEKFKADFQKILYSMKD